MVRNAGYGGYLVYLSDGDVPFFRVSFSAIISRTGYQKEGKFSRAGCQNMSKEECLLKRVIMQSNFCVFEYTFYRFFLEQGII